MGLTVHYRFEFKGRKTELVNKLRWLKECFDDLPVKLVGDVVEIKRASLEKGYGKYGGERFARNALGFMMMLGHFERSGPEKAMNDIIEHIKGWANVGALFSREKRRLHSLRRRVEKAWQRRQDRVVGSGNGLWLMVDPGAGCEHFAVALGRLGNGKVWRGLRFTKTQYAEHFVDAHLTVITMLDLCKEAGILKSVNDEGHYWETRNIDVLAKNINASTEMIRMMSAAFDKIARTKGWQTSSAIDRSANYVRTQPDSPRSG